MRKKKGQKKEEHDFLRMLIAVKPSKDEKLWLNHRVAWAHAGASLTYCNDQKFGCPSGAMEDWITWLSSGHSVRMEIGG